MKKSFVKILLINKSDGIIGEKQFNNYKEQIDRYIDRSRAKIIAIVDVKQMKIIASVFINYNILY